MGKFAFFSLVLAICNIALLFLLVSKKPLHHQTNWSTTNNGPKTELIPLQGPAGTEAKPFTLYIFFHADGDCGCLEDWPNWVEMHANHQDILNVKGVFNGVDQEKFLGFSRGFDLQFPLFSDPGGAFRENLGVRRGAVSKFLMGPTGEILLADTNQTSPRKQKAFKERLSEHLNRY